MKYFKHHLFILALCCAAVSLRADLVAPILPQAPPASARAASPIAAGPGVKIVTSTADDGPGSLRAAISNAVAGDVIQFSISGSAPAVIELKSELYVDESISIVGPGPDKLIVARAFDKHTPSFRVFEFNSDNATISELTIMNGRALNPDGQSDNLGGGIFNWKNLVIDHCVITKNEAPNGNGGRGFGGGIFSVGQLSLLRSTVSHNEAGAAGGGISTFESPSVYVSQSTIHDNEAGVQGGGVSLQGSIGNLINTTISGNEVEDDGVASGLLVLGFPSETAGVSLSSCTIAKNEGDDTDTNAAVVVAALPGAASVALLVHDTLAANNDPRNYAIVGDAVLASLGHNLDSDGSSGWTNGSDGNLVGTSDSPIKARLGKLDWYGGPTKTHALKAGSPAIDAGDCGDSLGQPLTVDQRGYPRPQGATCDIGAVENQPPVVICPENLSIDCKDDVEFTVIDPDGDAMTVVWSVDGVLVQTNSVSADRPPEEETVELKMSLSGGSHTVEVTASDANGLTGSCAATFQVEDTKPPKIKSIKVTPKSLSPANNQLVPVTLQVKTDDCGPVQVHIVSVRSNQPAGVEPDWIITGDLTLELRATRTGDKDRTYTITVEATDSAGNTSRDTVTVKVKDKGHDDDEDHDHGHDR